MTLIDKIKIGAALVMTLGWFYVWLRIRMLKADNDRLKQAAALAARESAALKQEAEANRAALDLREKRRAELAAEKEALTDELEKTYAADQDSRAWADAAVPGPVLDRLRK